MPWLRQPEYVRQVQRLEALQARSPHRDLTVIALGTSRTENDLQGSEAEAVLEHALGHPFTFCNFGRAGATPFTELLTLKRLLADGHRPDLLLIEVLPAELDASYELVDTSELYLPTVTARASELSLLASYGDSRRDSSLDWYLQWLCPFHTYRKTILTEAPGLSRRCPPPPAVDAWGWFPLWPENYPATVVQALENATRRHYAHHLKLLEPGGKPVELLRMLLDLCRREHIPTAIVLMPEGPSFRSMYGPGKLEHIRAFLAGLSQQFNIPVIDALEWLDNDKVYLDWHHLLEKGAESFTRRLAGEAIAPLLHLNSDPHGGSRFAHWSPDSKGAR
jgi:hypothetical protein